LSVVDDGIACNDLYANVKEQGNDTPKQMFILKDGAFWFGVVVRFFVEFGERGEPYHECQKQQNRTHNDVRLNKSVRQHLQQRLFFLS
jgi:hypothetical protein